MPNDRYVVHPLGRVFFAAVCLAASLPFATAMAGSKVTTEYGVVEGFSRGGLDSYLGIPYASPPVGDLRWRPPQAPASWQGVLQTKTFGNICPNARYTTGSTSRARRKTVYT